MRVRILQLRLLAAGLATLWGIAAGFVLVGYRPGGPADLLVGLAASLSLVLPVAAFVWPPAARSERATAAIAWLGLSAGLLLVPSLGGIVTQLGVGGAQTLLPSVEAAYPWLLALFATGLFAGLGIARRRLGSSALRRERLTSGLAIATLGTLLVTIAFGSAALANEDALRDRPLAASRYGPTSGTARPTTCDGELSAGSTARVTLDLDGVVDRRPLGSVRLDGTRDGADFRWSAEVATWRRLGTYGAARVGADGWTHEAREPWLAVGADGVAGLDLDAQLVRVALRPPARVAAEDRGIETIEGAPARHCRIAVDGPTLRAAVPHLDWFLAGTAEVTRWRGEIDYWVFLDHGLGRVEASLNGPALPAGIDGVTATLRVTMSAVFRGRPLTVRAPRAGTR